MALQNRETAKASVDEFIDRTAGGADPLIQKSEDKIIRTADLDNVVFKIPQVKDINNPSASVNVDFGLISGAYNDEFAIDTTSSVPSEFNITLVGLEGNAVGKLDITKKTGQTFTFVNATVLTRGGVENQVGLITLQYNIFKVGSTIYAVPLYEQKKTVKIDSSEQIFQAIFDIGDWDMNATTSISVSTGLDPTKVRSISAMIRIDSNISSGAILKPINSIDSATGLQNGGVLGIGNLASTDKIELYRVVGKDFDSTSYDETSYNRGWLTVTYVA